MERKRPGQAESELPVEIPQRGLVIALNKAKREAHRLSLVAKILKDAVVDGEDGLRGQYHQFVVSEFANNEIRPHALPGHKNTFETNQEHIKTLPGGDKRRIKYYMKYTEKYNKDKKIKERQIETETVRIDDPDAKFSKNYVYINFTTELLDMRDGTSHQTLHHGSHHLDPISAVMDPDLHADILDVFTDELKLLENITI